MRVNFRRRDVHYWQYHHLIARRKDDVFNDVFTPNLLNPPQTALFKIRQSNMSTTPQIAANALAQRLTQGLLCLFNRLRAHVRVTGI